MAKQVKATKTPRAVPAKVAEMCKTLTNNGGMIRVYRANSRDVAVVLKTFRVSDVEKFLRNKVLSHYTVEQAAK